MDRYDRQILDILQQDGRISNQDLAERIGLSPAPTLRRVRALEESGMIVGYRTLLDAYQSLLLTRINRIPGVSGVHSSFVLRRVVDRTAMPLPADQA